MKWGQLLHEAAMPVAHTAERHEGVGEDRRPRRPPFLRPRRCSARSRRARGRRQGRPGSGHAAARPAVGTAPRRQRLPVPGREAHARPPAPAEYEVLDVPVVATPIRILLVTARPEDEACGYIDHRASALPLVEAMESLPAWSRSTSSARRRCRPCARNSTAPAARRSPITSSTSTATASMTRGRPRRAVLRASRRTSASWRSAGTSPSSPDATRPAAARSPHPARLPRSLPDRAGREGVRVRRLRAAEGRRRLRGGHEPQRAGRDGAPVRRGVLRGARRRASAWATPCSPASAS